MSQISTTGTCPFELEVPYELIETGEEGRKPLVVYLHGYKQNMTYFKKKFSNLLSYDAWHLFMQGPYPIYDEKHNRPVNEWGRAWYLYDGGQEQFIRSMEKSSVFIEKLMEELSTDRAVSKRIILGYSMGGYLAGYFALSRPAIADELVTIGARIKTEHFKDNRYPYLNVLAVHGRKDQSVAAGPQKRSCSHLRKMGAKVSFRTVEAGHRLTEAYIGEVMKWIGRLE